MDNNKKNETYFEKLKNARRVLGLGEEATTSEIKDAYRQLIKHWHPDKSLDKDEFREEKTREIIEAHKLIMDYCNEYKISFSRDAVDKYKSEDEFWMERFGNDPMWSAGA